MKWLFYVAKLYSIPVVQPLVEEAQKHGVEFAFYTSRKVERHHPDTWSKFPVLTNLNMAIDFQPEFVLCPGNFVDFRLPGLKVELFHGIGIEKPSHYKIRHFFDLYFTSGPVVTERFQCMQKRYRYFNVVETGWPKVDYILSYQADGLREKFNIPEGKKVILYAPTHSRKMQSAEALLPIIEDSIAVDEIWFCKPHEFMNRDLLTGLSNKSSHRFRLVSDHDITPFLHMADVLISDTSSVVYEMMLLDKPVITYRTLSREDKGINIQSPNELREALDRCLKHPKEFQEIRSRHLDEVNPRRDGSIATTLFHALADIDPAQPVGPRKKPMNLFRKAQILYHSRYRKGYLR